MGFGKMKNVWPVLLLVIVGVAVIAIAMKQNKVEKEAVTFQDMFAGTKAGKAYQAASDKTADPVQSPAIVANSDASPNVLYAVQLYSFKEKFRADTIVNSLKTAGVPAYMQMSDLGDRGTWYRVRVGSFKTAEEAQQLLTELKKEHQDSIVVKEKK